jgi:hypothetical protein
MLTVLSFDIVPETPKTCQLVYNKIMEAVQEVAVAERRPYEVALEQMRQEWQKRSDQLQEGERPGDDLVGLQQVVDRFTKASELDDPQMQQTFAVDSGLAKDAASLREDPLEFAADLEREIWLKEKRGQVSVSLARGVTDALDHFRKLYSQYATQIPDQSATKMPISLLRKAG